MSVRSKANYSIHVIIVDTSDWCSEVIFNNKWNGKLWLVTLYVYPYIINHNTYIPFDPDCPVSPFGPCGPCGPGCPGDPVSLVIAS